MFASTAVADTSRNESAARKEVDPDSSMSIVVPTMASAESPKPP